VARLILEFNQEVLRDYPIRSRSITIGRQEDNTIVLDNPRVSSYHARIDKTGSDHILTDLQSTNGTFVNNENVVSRKLLHGDRIAIGKHVLLFVGTEKAKVEAEKEDIPLNQTVIIGVKPKGKEMTPLPEIERREFGIREDKSSRPFVTILPIFLLIFILVGGGWFILSHTSLLRELGFSRSVPKGANRTGSESPRQSVGKTHTDELQPDAIAPKSFEEPIPSNEIEKPEDSLPLEEPSPMTTSEESELAATPSGELFETPDPAVAGALQEESFKLDGIVWSSDAKQSFAVINGIILRLGGSVEGAVVADIGRNYVVLRSREGDSEIRLSIR
jgi:pSer/pThr/pTyr-binding forkhead associated (FHA) protein